MTDSAKMQIYHQYQWFNNIAACLHRAYLELKHNNAGEAIQHLLTAEFNGLSRQITEPLIKEIERSSHD
jgi:hypothetical protein